MADNVFDINDYGQYFVEEMPDEGVVEIPVESDETRAGPPDVSDAAVEAPENGVGDTGHDGTVTDAPAASGDAGASEASNGAPGGNLADDKALNGTDSAGDEKTSPDGTQSPVVVQETLTTPEPVYMELMQDMDTRIANMENYGLVSVVGIALVLGVLVCKILLDKFWR